jgi:N-acetylglucosamine-6-phosphate deacetylase
MEGWSHVENERLISGIDYRSGRRVRIEVKEGKIVTKEYIETNDKKAVRAEEQPIIAPGLIDLQINGYNGMDFNTLPLTIEDVSRVTRAILSLGVTSYFPTVITNSDDNICILLRTIAEACRVDRLVQECIPGIHLEGPYISGEDGPRGAHDRSYVQPPNWEQFKRWQDCAEDRIRLITLSPEWDEAETFIRKCVDSGVTVSIGHTAARPEQIHRAIAAGATLSTHLGNGAHLQLPRHPNYIWEQLARDELWASMIADGYHLPDSVLRVIRRVKDERCIIVSDAVALSGMPPGRYHTHIGGDVILTPGGKLHMAANERSLAGSAQMLPSAIEHLLRSQICDVAEAWDMASSRPARLMRLPNLASGIEVGETADFVLFTWNGESLDIQQIYKHGIAVEPEETRDQQ